MDLRIELDVLDIWVPADLLNHILVEVTSIAHQAWDVVGVLETLEDLLLEACLISLLELCLVILISEVHFLHPAMMGLSVCICDMLLEEDHVCVGNGLRV